MTPESQRIAIAEACGARWFDVTDGFGTWRCITFLDEGAEDHPNREPLPIPIKCVGFWHVPDYLNDLNAMHEAEKMLTDEKHSLFRKLLFTGFYNRGEGITNEAAERARVSATAAQRAEAFLRTIGKWQDSPHP